MKKTMISATTRFFFLSACCALATLCAPLASVAAPATADTATATSNEFRPLDRIVAVVNRDVITEYELQTRTHQVAINLRRQGIELPGMHELRSQVLERLILEKAIGQRAEDTGIRVDEQMVTDSIEQIAQNNHMTVSELRNRLTADGTSYSAFRDQIRQEIVLQRLRQREVDSKIQIPESEINAYLAEKAGFATDETTEYHIYHILVPILPEDANGSKAEDLAESIVDRAKKGEDFAKLAAEYSKADDALEGGDLGWKDASRMPSIFWKAIQANPKKGAVALTRTSEAFHIVRIADERDGVKAKLAGAPVTQNHIRQILLFVSDVTPEADVIARLNDIRRKILAKQGDFASFARLNSVDNSATRGGDLGWASPGDLPPEIEEQVNRLNVGEISEPFKTRYGYHLIELVDRQEKEADPERNRYAARQALRERKLAEAFSNWQRELRDQAYVEIRHENL